MSWTLRDYQCGKCGCVFESLEVSPAPRTALCGCGGSGRLVMAAPKLQMHSGPGSVSVTRGKSDERPPWALDTRHLARD